MLKRVLPSTCSSVAPAEAAPGGPPDRIAVWFFLRFPRVSELSVLVLRCRLGIPEPSLALEQALGRPIWIVVAAPQYGAGVAFVLCVPVPYQGDALRGSRLS
jgi:hypothetical protein